MPSTPWIIASGLADAEHSGGHIYLVNRQDRSLQVLLPGHVVYRQDSATFGACPGAPDETKFSAHGLSLRAGPASEATLYVVHHGERESVEVFTLTAGPAAPSLTWVGCVLYPAGVFTNGVAALPDGAFAATIFLRTDDPKAAEKLTAGQPEGGVLIWRPKTGWEDVPGAAASPRTMALPPRRMASSSSWRERGTRPWSACRSTAQQESRAVIKTGFHTDNLRWGSDGFLYAAGARDSVANLFACAPNTTRRCTNPFSVLRIDPVTLQTREVVHHSGTPSFGAASTALRIGNEYWFATPHGDRIAIAPAD